MAGSIAKRPAAWLVRYSVNGEPRVREFVTQPDKPEEDVRDQDRCETGVATIERPTARAAAERFAAGLEGSKIARRPEAWRARYRDAAGKEHAKHFKYKNNPKQPHQSAQHWLDTVTAAVVTNTYLDPQAAKRTVGEWSAIWLGNYSINRESTVRQAESHMKRIVERFGSRPLTAVKPSDVKKWMAELNQEGLALSTRRALHGRLAHLFADAIEDNLLNQSPVSRKTSPGAPEQRPYVATTDQVWALYDAMPETMRPAILLGAFVGLRVAEIVALRVEDVDFMRGVVSPSIQYPANPLKTKTSRTPIPIPADLALELNRVPARWKSPTLVVGVFGRPISPYTLQTAFRAARQTVAGLPTGFRIHDLRHYFASLLIASGLDVKVVQTRLRHSSAKTTLDTYGHLWPDKDESARAAVQQVMAARADSMRTQTADAR